MNNEVAVDIAEQQDLYVPRGTLSHMPNRATLVKHDALFMWFDEVTTEECACIELTDQDTATVEMVKNLVNGPRSTITLRAHVQPDWKTIRDNATYIFGAYGKDKEGIRINVRAYCDVGVIHVNYDLHADQDKGSPKSLMSKLDNLCSTARQTIKSNIVANMDTAEALDFLDMAQCQLLSDGVPRWYREANWLTTAFNQAGGFGFNFHTIIIHGAGKAILTNEYNPSRLFHHLALMGRINTHVIFLG